MDALARSPEVDLRGSWRGEPVTDEVIAEVHRAIGYELDPRFLEFFRVCDGLEVIWVSRRLERRDAPVDHFLAHVATGMAGRIHVPSLRAIFIDGPGDKFGPDMMAPQEYTEACLGGWDSHALRAALRDLDDYLAAPDYPSYFIPALVASRRYPDPPVLLATDHGACLEDNHPMLARDYLALIIATLGIDDARRRRLESRGYGGNHALFVAPEGWLDEAPRAREFLAAIHGDASAAEVQAVRARIDAIVDGPGQPVASTPYAHYNTTPTPGDRVVSSDPLEGMRQRMHDPEAGAPYLEHFKGRTLTLPIHAADHYVIEEAISADDPLDALRSLIGEPVKVEGKTAAVGCLIRVGDDGSFALYREGDGFRGVSTFGLSTVERVGRARHAAIPRE